MGRQEQTGDPQKQPCTQCLCLGQGGGGGREGLPLWSVPAKVPHDNQAVLGPREEVAAVVCEGQAREVLIVSVQDGKEVTTGDLQTAWGEKRREL